MKTVSIDRAAEILQVSRRTIYNHIRRGYLQTIRTIGGQSQRVTLESLTLVQGAGRRRGERFFVAPSTPPPDVVNHRLRVLRGHLRDVSKVLRGDIGGDR